MPEPRNTPMTMEELRRIPIDRMNEEQLVRYDQLLGLEERRLRMQEASDKKAARVNRHKKSEEMLALRRRVNNAVWRKCSHMKGGSGRKAVHVGGDDNRKYAVITHKYAHEDAPAVQCQRCDFTWYRGTTAKKLRRISPDDNARFNEFSTGADNPTGIAWETAIQWPTTNQPSGSVTFQFPKERAEDGQRELAPA